MYVHKKTKSLDSDRLNKTKFRDKKKETTVSSLNKTMIKSNLLSTSKRNLSRYEYEEDLKKKYIFDDNSFNSEDLKHDSDMVMADYKYAAVNANNQFDNFDRLVEKDLNDIIFTNRSFKRNNNLPLLESINNESQLKICINVKDYNNPIKAFSTISKNKIIHESMVQNYYEVQKKKFNDYLKQIEHAEIMYNTTKFRKIKITTMAPKNNVEQFNNITNNSNSDKKEQQNQINIGVSLKNDMDCLEMYGYYVYSYKLFPEGREQFSFSYDNTDAIVYGGLITNKSNKIWKLDPSTLTWSVLDYDTQSINVRSGHSGVLFQKRLYLFGGRSKLQNFHFMQDLEIFNLEDRTWTTPNVHSKNNLKLRRNHVGLVVGQQMFVHGGISEDDQYLDDCHLLSFYPLKWSQCTVNIENQAPLLASHSACLVLPFELAFHPKFNIYKIPEIGINRRVYSRIKDRGIYLFGGKSSEDGGLQNDLWILRIGKKPLEWFKPDTSGSPPCPRYSHSMNFYEEGNYLIIHGGRNDYSSESFALNDTYLFELYKQEWIKVKLFFDSPRTKVFSRCCHAGIVYTNKLILLGGMNNLNYIGASVFILDLDSHANPNRSHYFKNESNEMDNIFKKIKINGKDDKKKYKESKSLAKRPISISNSNSQLPPIK